MNYYVTTSGNDSNAGTSSAPFRTPQRAANLVLPGDTVNILSADYPGFVVTRNGTADKRIMFTGGGRIEGTNDGINLEGASFITVQGLRAKGARAGIRSVKNTGVQIIGNTCDKCGMWGILTGFSENILVEGNTCSNSVNQHGIYLGNSADNPIARKNTVFGNRQSGIQLNGDKEQGGDGIISGALIEDNIVYNNGLAPAGSAINLDGVIDSIVRNNKLTDNHASGISIFRQVGGAACRNIDLIGNEVKQAADGRFALNVQNASQNIRIFPGNVFEGGKGPMDVSADSKVVMMPAPTPTTGTVLQGIPGNYNIRVPENASGQPDFTKATKA